MKPFCLIVAFVLTAAVVFAENTNYSFIAGTFGTAWLDNDGIVRLYDGTKITEPVPKTKVYAILAADLLKEGADQLIYLDDDKKALHIYSFKTQNTLGPFGNGVRTMAVGRCSTDETFPSLFVCTFRGDAFRWTKEIMDKGWHPVSGSFTQASKGRFDSRSDLDDFVVVSEGNVYIYSTKWKTYSKVCEGKNIAAVLAGNFTVSPGDEIAMFDKEGSVFLYQNKTLEDLRQKAKCLAFGHNKEGLDMLYALDTAGEVVRYNRETKKWTAVGSNGTRRFINLIVKEGQALFVLDEYECLCQERSDNDEFHPLSTPWDNRYRIFWKDSKSLARYRNSPMPFEPREYFKSYIDELRTPSGKNILRDSPDDHIHHHGLMYAIRVGGFNFWEEGGANSGKQVETPQRSLGAAYTENTYNWNTPDSKTLLVETRKISVDTGDNVTFLDWQSSFKAVVDTVLGTEGAGHYNGLGMRFVEEMDKGGRFFNSTGKKEDEVVRGDERMTPCKWMAYTAKVGGQPVTAAVFDHPSNPVPMTAFTMGDAGGAFAYLSATMDLHRKPVELSAGQTFAFKYRVAVWDGEVSPEIVEKAYQNFVQ